MITTATKFTPVPTTVNDRCNASSMLNDIVETIMNNFVRSTTLFSHCNRIVPTIVQPTMCCNNLSLSVYRQYINLLCLDLYFYTAYTDNDKNTLGQELLINDKNINCNNGNNNNIH